MGPINANQGCSRRGSALVLLASLLVCCPLLAHTSAAHAQAGPAPAPCPAPPPGATATGSVSPSEIVVCVQSLPITLATFTHWAEVARKSEGTPKHPADAKEVAKEVLGFLISSDWVLEEAHALHVVVPARTVRREFERIRAQQFPKPGEFGKFLISSGQTPADLMFRVKLNLLSARIQARVLAAHHDARDKQRALARFAGGFKRRWQSRTYCTPEYASIDCGHVVSPPL